MAPSRNDIIRLLTLNTHSLMEPDNEACIDAIARMMIREQVDVAAFQEVNQLTEQPLECADVLTASGFVRCPSDPPLRKGNFALLLAQHLRRLGANYQWTWAYAHDGYVIYDEGIALFSRNPIQAVRDTDVSAVPIPGIRMNRRRILGIRTEAFSIPAWFWSVHMGWWDDPHDPFLSQWQKTEMYIRSEPGHIWVMGDFNNPADKRQEGYDTVCQSGFMDCYTRAARRDSGITVGEQIDGWRKNAVDPMRLDMVFAGQPGLTQESRVVFNGTQDMIVSDHFGILTVEDYPGDNPV